MKAAGQLGGRVYIVYSVNIVMFVYMYEDLLIKETMNIVFE